MLAMSDDDSRKSSSPQRSKSTVSSSGNEIKHTAKDKSSKESNSVKPNMVYIVSNPVYFYLKLVILVKLYKSILFYNNVCMYIYFKYCRLFFYKLIILLICKTKNFNFRM